MARKVNKHLVALGSAAVIAVYGIGFARTASSALANPDSTSVQAVATATMTQPAASQPALGLAQVTTAAYRDGTYTASGTSRFGGIAVAVTIQGGKITGVTLTKVTTSYPATRIAQLPGQVVARQSANVDLVSGATYSSQAFRDAVAQALAQTLTGSTQG